MFCDSTNDTAIFTFSQFWILLFFSQSSEQKPHAVWIVSQKMTIHCPKITFNFILDFYEAVNHISTLQLLWQIGETTIKTNVKGKDALTLPPIGWVVHWAHS